MAEIFVIVAAVVMIVIAWSVYAWGRKTVQRLNKGKPSQILRALLVMCVYVTVVPALTFGGGNYWLAWMLTIPFMIVMAVWLGYIASLVSKRRAPAMTQETPIPEGVKIRTVPVVEAYSAGGGKQRGRRSSSILREVEA